MTQFTLLSSLLAALWLLVSSPSAAQAITSNQIRPLLTQTFTVMRQHYIAPERIDAIEQWVLARQHAGAYQSITTLAQFAKVVGGDIRQISGDAHLSLYVQAKGEPISHILPTPTGKLSHNFAFEQLRYLPGNIGYLKFNKFSPDDGAMAVADQAMLWLQQADALIIDLRDTVGGSPQLAQHLLSYFFAADTPLWRVYWRGDEVAEQIKALAVAKHDRFKTGIPLLLLTSDDSASATELFASVLQANGKARTVGSVSGGAGYYVGVEAITEQLIFRISKAKPVISINNRNWEGVGVLPDVAVPAMDALDRAQHLLRTEQQSILR
ncbi:S41 family peptidase [uncultured Ferrimonas sp.]|uniref:S41 family peptidase n=1 Tax=uncultured Ferrimonas sp. TaxID=432640 RepID=UPI00262059A4|nr:S41 family peptidase [uncultured Ferrimonas sp.]